VKTSLWTLVMEALFTLNLQAFLWMFVGTVLGVFGGFLPGVNATMVLVILLPLTYSMPLESALGMLLAAYGAAIFGGSGSAILLNTPGTGGSAATALDGFALTKKGKGNQALGIASMSSFLGGFISVVILLLLMRPLARFALRFGPPEYFAVSIFGVSIIASVTDNDTIKGIMAGVLGLLLGTVGMSLTGQLRGTMGNLFLTGGINTVPAMMGLFALTSAFNLINEKSVMNEGVQHKRNFKEELEGCLITLKHLPLVIWTAIIGTVIGILPGAGASIACWAAYKESFRFTKNPPKLGTGHYQGVIAPESANNAAQGGALITTFALGIPGSGASAVLLSALLLHGVTAGPQLLVQGIDLIIQPIVLLVISFFVCLVIGLIFEYVVSGVVNIPTKIIAPVIIALGMTGSYAFRGAIFDCFTALVFGILGYIMSKTGYSRVAMVLGLILGKMTEQELVRTSIRFGGDFSVFFTRPISCVILVVSILSILYSLVMKLRTSKN
jgi:putative tricarboxylic transport membrane protein